jgi:hypothetical protein
VAKNFFKDDSEELTQSSTENHREPQRTTENHRGIRSEVVFGKQQLTNQTEISPG